MSELNTHTLPLESFFDKVSRLAQQNCFIQPIEGGSTVEFTWKEVDTQVRTMATYLQSLGLEPGSRIALGSQNCAYWIMADLAIWMAGYVSVPLYPVLTTKSFKQIIDHSECSAVFIGKLDNPTELMAALPEGIPVISCPLTHPQAQVLGKGWDSIIAQYSPIAGHPSRDADDLATLIYTSGTTGMPKGVMHSFRNLAAAGMLGTALYDQSPSSRLLSFLPLAHAAERLAVELCQMYSGLTVYFTHSLETFPDDLLRAQPTTFFAVPRIWSKFQQRVNAQIPEKKLKLLLSIPIVSGIVRKKLTTALGLNRVDIALSGAAPLSTTLLAWYRRLGIEILEGYAMTENLAYSHGTKIGLEKIGSVGSANPEVDCKIAESGEILIKSPTNMQGYYKQPDITREMLDDEGYLHTGDKGELDSLGRLSITGRIKDIFKTSKGKYVAPAPIEDMLLSNSNFEHVCVTGANLTNPIALFILSEDTQANLKANPALKDELTQELAELRESVNSRLDKHEQLSYLTILDDEWSVDTNCMTPTMKLKRDVIESKYVEFFTPWLAEKAPVLWQ